MELKSSTRNRPPMKERGSNRTFMELKFYTWDIRENGEGEF